ncbi:paraquat-inducible protein B [Candidatus Pantoea edessiphila]|uniref:Paraquat-inducible protein B n=1 Tax=Candidatus Pantoea edessiphila TaxID=2044610 RepID=A0A2P5T0L1_9GAMM|nr:intermembrane transport protein PqiB [Candidatus Pantoea edessiphila]PPI88093.1 paraquat-inducible protein B [Candidatus Pantoea edessiphila]
MEINYKHANLSKIKNRSSIWIFLSVTLFVATWIMIYQLIHLGPEVTLITNNARGIEEERTIIKSHNVNVGLVKKISISKNLNNVEIKVRLNSGMQYLLQKDTIFWVVKPQIKHEGINGLSKVLAGVYIELYPGKNNQYSDKKNKLINRYNLMKEPPTVLPNAKGTRVILESTTSQTLSEGDPVLFHGYRVGTVENIIFNTKNYKTTYQLFIEKPYINLINNKTCFWKNSGISANLSTSNMSIEIGRFNNLFNNSISFDTKSGCFSGKYINNKKLYYLLDNQNDTEKLLQNHYTNYVLLFSSSIRGLKVGAPVEFRGIRIGTVSEVPFLKAIMKQKLNYSYEIPVLIQIEPARFIKILGKNFNLDKLLKKKKVLYGIIKTNNFLSDSHYIDLDFYNNEMITNKSEKILGYKVIPTIDISFDSIQQKIVILLDKINRIPINDIIKESNNTLKEGTKIIKDFNLMINTVKNIMTNPTIKNLPEDMHQAIDNLNILTQELQPGSETYNRTMSNMQTLNQVLNELQSILKILNINSNALIYRTEPDQDPQPKRI